MSCQFNKGNIQPICQFLSVTQQISAVAQGLFIIQRNAKVTEIT